MDADALSALLGRHAVAHAVPGAALGILRAGTTTTAYHGLADVATGTPVAPETRFSVGSLTKSMVATVVVRLAGLGRLSLDDPIAARVPELLADSGRRPRRCGTCLPIGRGSPFA